MERSDVIFPAPPRTRATRVVGSFRDSQEQPNLRPKTQKIKLYAGPRKALRVP